MTIGLHHHNANPGQVFHESRTGLDRISFGVAERADLDVWASWLDELGIKHSGVIDTRLRKIALGGGIAGRMLFAPR